MYSKILLVLMSMIMSQSAIAGDYHSQIKSVTNDIQGILINDKKKTEYQDVLSSVKLFPEFNSKSREAYEKDFHQYVKTLLPYLLKKIKNNDVNGEFNHFHKLVSLSSDIDSVIEMSTIEKVSFDLCKESLKTEKILRACSNAISKYGDKKLQMEVQLNRFDGIVQRNLSDAIELSQDYSDLRRSVSSTVSEK